MKKVVYLYRIWLQDCNISNIKHFFVTDCIITFIMIGNNNNNMALMRMKKLAYFLPNLAKKMWNFQNKPIFFLTPWCPIIMFDNNNNMSFVGMEKTPYFSSIWLKMWIFQNIPDFFTVCIITTTMIDNNTNNNIPLMRMKKLVYFTLNWAPKKCENFLNKPDLVDPLMFQEHCTLNNNKNYNDS